eukprot:31399-Pelagococcus_subviridis.AAC.2
MSRADFPCDLSTGATAEIAAGVALGDALTMSPFGRAKSAYGCRPAIVNAGKNVVRIFASGRQRSRASARAAAASSASFAFFAFSMTAFSVTTTTFFFFFFFPLESLLSSSDSLLELPFTISVSGRGDDETWFAGASASDSASGAARPRVVSFPRSATVHIREHPPLSAVHSWLASALHARPTIAVAINAGSLAFAAVISSITSASASGRHFAAPVTTGCTT